MSGIGEAGPSTLRQAQGSGQGAASPPVQPSEDHYRDLQRRYALEIDDALKRMPAFAMLPLVRDDVDLDDFRHRYALILLGVLLGLDVPADDAKWLAVDTAAFLAGQLARINQTVGSA